MNGLEKITARIEDDAKAQAEATLAAARAKADAISAEYEARAAEILEAAEKRAAADSENTLARARASVEAMRRNAVEATRSHLLDEVYAQAMREVKNFSLDVYTKLLVHQLIEVLKEQVQIEKDSRALYGKEGALKPETYEVLLNAQDRSSCGEAMIAAFRTEAVKAGLTKTMVGKVTLGEETAKIDGGLVLRTGDIEMNCSLDTMFRELRAETEGKVLKTLFP